MKIQFLFFLKKKTAYGLLISGCSSVVCSADLVRVVVVEHGPCVAGDRGDVPRPYIEARLRELGIETIVGSGVSGLDEGGVALDDGARIETDTVIWSAGMRASPLTAQLPGERDTLGRVLVDPDLRVPGAPHKIGRAHV